ncbi:hypothetical protein L1887_23576 [Cichorium endivia]|nr:hypothetical protein L1887_23576 [Cichorium endivia]
MTSLPSSIRQHANFLPYQMPALSWTDLHSQHCFPKDEPKTHSNRCLEANKILMKCFLSGMPDLKLVVGGHKQEESKTSCLGWEPISICLHKFLEVDSYRCLSEVLISDVCYQRIQSARSLIRCLIFQSYGVMHVLYQEKYTCMLICCSTCGNIKATLPM